MSLQSQRANLLEMLASDLAERVAQGEPQHDAFARLAAEWLGYDSIPDDQFIFQKDRGVDYYDYSEILFEVFQCKSHKTKQGGEIDTSPFDSDGVKDLTRAYHLMINPEIPQKVSEPVKVFLERWQLTLRNLKANISGGRRPKREPKKTRSW